MKAHELVFYQILKQLETSFLGTLKLIILESKTSYRNHYVPLI